jgi:hypothetical protein
LAGSAAAEGADAPAEGADAAAEEARMVENVGNVENADGAKGP